MLNISNLPTDQLSAQISILAVSRKLLADVYSGSPGTVAEIDSIISSLQAEVARRLASADEAKVISMFPEEIPVSPEPAPAPVKEPEPEARQEPAIIAVEGPRTEVTLSKGTTAEMAEDKKAGLITYFDIKGSWLSQGEGSSHNATINLKAKTVQIWGVNTNHVKGPYKYNRTFAIGDMAEYASYNYAYTGKITAIGAKTITIDPGKGYSTQTRLNLNEFIGRNYKFDPERIANDRNNWMD